MAYCKWCQSEECARENPVSRTWAEIQREERVADAKRRVRESIEAFGQPRPQPLTVVEED